MQPALRIVVVDDDRDFASCLAVYFGMLGHFTRLVHNGLAVEAMVDSFNPHVILVDIGLPGMDGYQVVRRLRERGGGCHAEIIALTGYGRSEDIEMARKAGFDRHLLKPVDLDELVRVIEGLPAYSLRTTV